MRRARVLLAAALAALLRLPSFAADAEPAQPKSFDLRAAQLQCARGTVDVEALLRESARDKTLDRALYSGPAAASREVDDYLLCRALPGGGDPLCADIGARAAFCRDEAAFLRFLWAAFQAKDAQSRCAQALPPEARAGSARFCALLAKAAREGGSLAQVCEQGRAAGLPKALSRDCPRDLAFLGGDARACAAAGESAEALERCRRRARLTAALRAGKAACRRLPDCAALSGERGACEPLRPQASVGLCRQLGAYIALQASASAPKAYSEKERKARDPEEVRSSTRKKKAEDDAAHGAALKEAALDKVRRADAQRRERDRQRFKRDYKQDEPMQDLPPDVKKQMREIEEKGRRDEEKDARPPQ